MAVFTHVRFGTNDMAAARAFYDAALGALGLKRLVDREDMLSAWGDTAPALMIGPPRDGGPATAANGGTVGLAAGTRDAVDAFHAAALAHGGSCEGAPGPRPFAPNAYAAYVRDPDGNKLGAFCYAPA